MLKLAREVIDLLRSKGLTLGITESATGGLISHIVTNVPGSSECYKGSVTAYANQTKTDVLGVKVETLQQYGAVSAPVAEEMASGGCRVLSADICLSDTGIAGPGGATPDKPVGLFYIGLAHHSIAYSQKHVFNGSRKENKAQAAQTALGWLVEYLKNME